MLNLKMHISFQDPAIKFSGVLLLSQPSLKLKLKKEPTKQTILEINEFYENSSFLNYFSIVLQLFLGALMSFEFKQRMMCQDPSFVHPMLPIFLHF